MNWGKSITMAFVFFAIFIGALVTICVRQEISLVSKNYYEEELDYQKHIERLNNTAQLSEKPEITVSHGTVQIVYKTDQVLDKGVFKLFRPSNLRFDKQFELQSFSEPIHQFNVKYFPKGMYRARMEWTSEGKEYFLEQVINL
jgi:hypothetical protein